MREQEAPGTPQSALELQRAAPVLHSYWLEAATPARLRKQSFQYVTPSQPQTGLGATSSQKTGRGAHLPTVAAQSSFSHSSPGEHCALCSQTSWNWPAPPTVCPAAPPPPPPPWDVSNRTSGSTAQADVASTAQRLTCCNAERATRPSYRVTASPRGIPLRCAAEGERASEHQPRPHARQLQ